MLIKKVKEIFNQRFDRWLTKRMPAVDSIILNRGNTFIFPSRFGLMFLTTATVLFLIGTNYQNNLILFLVFFMLSFMITCLLLSYQNLAGLELTANNSKDQFTNENCTFSLRIKANKGGAEQTHYRFKKSSAPLESVIQEERVQLFAKSAQRGWFKPGRVTIESNYPFGLFNVWTHLDFGFCCLLYPTPIESSLSNIALSGEQTDNGLRESKVGFETFNTLKPYQQGESLKSVAWKQVAQGKGFFTKQFEQEQGGNVYLSLSDFQGQPIEKTLSMLTYQVINHEQLGVNYALDLGGAVIEVGGGEQHQLQCLRALALYGKGDGKEYVQERGKQNDQENEHNEHSIKEAKQS